MLCLEGNDVERGRGDDPRAPAHPAQPGLPRAARQLRQPHPQEARLDMMMMMMSDGRNIKAQKNPSPEEKERRCSNFAGSLEDFAKDEQTRYR